MVVVKKVAERAGAGAVKGIVVADIGRTHRTQALVVSAGVEMVEAVTHATDVPVSQVSVDLAVDVVLAFPPLVVLNGVPLSVALGQLHGGHMTRDRVV